MLPEGLDPDYGPYRIEAYDLVPREHLTPPRHASSKKGVSLIMEELRRRSEEPPNGDS